MNSDPTGSGSGSTSLTISTTYIYHYDRLLTPAEVKEYCGLVRTDDLIGGLWVPGILQENLNFYFNCSYNNGTYLPILLGFPAQQIFVFGRHSLCDAQQNCNPPNSASRMLKIFLGGQFLPKAEEHAKYAQQN